MLITWTQHLNIKKGGTLASLFPRSKIQPWGRKGGGRMGGGGREEGRKGGRKGGWGDGEEERKKEDGKRG